MNENILPIPKSYMHIKKYTQEQWETLSRICTPTTYDDLTEYGIQCGYSSGWAYYTAKDFGIEVPEKVYSYVIEDGERYTTIYSDTPIA